MIEHVRAASAAVVLVSVATMPAAGVAQEDAAVQLPDGEAKAVIQGTCSACHRLDYLPNARGYSEEGWRHLISAMVALPAGLQDSVVDYLAENFPKKPGTDPVLVEGPVEVTITEWLAPTLGSRPHDPAPGSNRSIWWAGQFANRIGPHFFGFRYKAVLLDDLPDQDPQGGIATGTGFKLAAYETRLVDRQPSTLH